MLDAPGGYDPYTDIRRVGFDMSFGIIDTTASDDATVSVTEESEISNSEQVCDGVEINSAKYGTLEHNFFLLDGYTTLVPDDLTGVQTGWMTNTISDSVGNINNTITVEFTLPHDVYGITLIYDQHFTYEAPAEVTLTFYNSSGTVISEITAIPDSAYHVIVEPVQDFKKLTIEYNGTKTPYRRCRLTEIIFGMVKLYDETSVVSMTDKSNMDLASESFASSELSVTIDNSDKLYNLINPAGVYEFLQEGQRVNYWLIINGVRINMGLKYFKSASSTDSGLTASIVFNDRALFLDRSMYNSGQTGTWTLQTAVNSILQSAGVTMTVNYSGSLASTTIRRCIPQNTTCREALRLCAQAACCICTIDRNDNLNFETVTFSTNKHELTRDFLSSEPSVTVGDKYNAVTVTRRDEYATNTDDESYTAADVPEGDMQNTKEINNPLVYNLQTVAEWLLTVFKRRTSFGIKYRGNPLLELGDTLKVYDGFGINGDAIIEEMSLEFNGGLNGSINARR